MDDKLEQIVGLQKELLYRIIEEREEANRMVLNKNKAIKNHVHAIGAEVAELRQEADWKWWTNEKEIDEDACIEECIDILHFTFQLLILLGCDADDIHRLYADKNEENHDRQDGETERKGYDPNSDENYEKVD